MMKREEIIGWLDSAELANIQWPGAVEKIADTALDLLKENDKLKERVKELEDQLSWHERLPVRGNQAHPQPPEGE
jgi:hypothetical protein